MQRKNISKKTHAEYLEKHANFLLALDYPSDAEPNTYEQLIKSLAFLYHFLKFNLAHYNVYGDTRIVETTNLRNYITHFASEIAVDAGTIFATHQQIKEHLQLSSLANISWLQDTKLYSDMQGSIHELDQRMRGNKEVNHDVFKIWMCEKIIPLINRLNTADTCHDMNQEECDAAFKMIMIIFGEYCKINRQKYFKKTEKEKTEIPDFILHSCKLRNIYAHDVVETVGLLQAAVTENASLINPATDIPQITADLFIPTATCFPSTPNDFIKKGTHHLTFSAKPTNSNRPKSNLKPDTFRHSKLF